MGVAANVKNKLGELWYRLKAWAHSVPPDVWIGLAIAAATLIVVYLAYKKAGGSSSVSGTDTGTSIPNLPITGGSSSLGVIPDTTPILDWGPIRLPGNPGLPSNVAATPDVGLNAALQNIYNQNESNGQNATIRAFQLAQQQQYNLMNSATTRDESSIVKAIQKTPTPSPIITSATTRDESSIVKALAPKKTWKPAPIRPSPFAVTPNPTGRGVNIVF